MMSEPSAATSLSLLDRVRGADPEAWRKLVLLYGPLVFAWAKRAGLSGDDAADVTQDVWTAVARSISRFERTAEAGTFRGWLWTVTRNKLRDHHRKHEPRGTGGSTAQHRFAEVPEFEPADSDTSTGTGGLVHRALDLIRTDFEERTWKAFWALAIEGKTASDVAATSGLSLDAVYQAKSRVLRRLREELGELVEAPVLRQAAPF